MKYATMDTRTDMTKLSVWWLTNAQADTATLKPGAPAYMREQLESRRGRNGRGRLWVDNQFGYLRLPRMENVHLDDADHLPGGIVIHTSDAHYCEGGYVRGEEFAKLPVPPMHAPRLKTTGDPTPCPTCGALPCDWATGGVVSAPAASPGMLDKPEAILPLKLEYIDGCTDYAVMLSPAELQYIIAKLGGDPDYRLIRPRNADDNDGMTATGVNELIDRLKRIGT